MHPFAQASRKFHQGETIMKPESEKTKPLKDTKIEEVLTEKPPTLDPGDSMQKAGDRMREMNVERWPVAKERKLLGAMDQPNPDRTVARFGHDPKDTRVGDNMSRDVVYCFEDQTCAEALSLMDARKLDYLPVVDRQQRICGILSREELLCRQEKEKAGN
jgi:predicted transcriptional regulator